MGRTITSSASTTDRKADDAVGNPEHRTGDESKDQRRGQRLSRVATVRRDGAEIQEGRDRAADEQFANNATEATASNPCRCDLPRVNHADFLAPFGMAEQAFFTRQATPAAMRPVENYLGR
jgi:hypothetical protein